MCYTGIQVKWVGIVHCATSFSQLSAFFSCYVGRWQDNWISILVELAAAFLLLPDHKVGFTVFFVADDRMAVQHPSVNCLSPPFVGGLVRLKSVRLW